MLVNPGGPGGSGVTIAMALGKSIQTVVGPHQDVIGFDPRGIGATTPRADCFSYPADGGDGEDDHVRGQFHRTLWGNAGRQIGLVNSSSVALQKLDTRARVQAKLCAEKDSLKGSDSIFRHLSTPTVARDMLSIVDAWDEWTAALPSESAPGKLSATDDKLRPDPSKGPISLDTKSKLVYWGFSYGTLLGATFAAMFPDRVGRLILDGVVDADHYVSPLWSESIRDADAVSRSFSRYCHGAAESCALYRDNDTVADIEERFELIRTSIMDHPITLIDPISKMPIVISYSDIRLVLFVCLYAPTQTFPIVAMILDSLYRGSDAVVGQIFGWPPDLELQPFCGPPPPPSLYPNEAQAAIMCSDKRYELNETIPNLHRLFEKLETESSWADVWMTLMIGCDGWQISAVDPPMRWDSNPANTSKPIKTSFPVLFISNTADPVTPLYAGVKMAQKFVDAGLIEQKSEGHCSLAAVSQCTMKKIRAYIEKGEVPPAPVRGGKGRELIDGKWDRCEADEWPFHPYESDTWLAAKGEVGVDDVESMDALRDMQKKFYRQATFLGQIGGLNMGKINDFVLQT
ncbi:uncharacterized protein BP5553_07370 [Venustampulla echinocandica]|uniref:Peptidase S33 tripeptidyl aminopeptidase-like C-terminal domain-containing protein n=1 Tax=Venustampulla echinocandica TaxID=2656787 RepID=A0A370TJA1_9HELO|nr:uncharacterized protein BP5553_07370 [Venustampulla echinocandica]RDL35439.1 hypothetical protein BP5553_07370 [Venustampulla echinocandica]